MLPNKTIQHLLITTMGLFVGFTHLYIYEGKQASIKSRTLAWAVITMTLTRFFVHLIEDTNDKILFSIIMSMLVAYKIWLNYNHDDSNEKI